MRTLLTGASGYVGLHILRELLEDGHRVTAVVRSPERLGPFAGDPRVEVVVADLEDGRAVRAALSGHDVCVHAALVWGEPGEEIAAPDVAVSSTLFDAAGNAGVERVILLSSTAVHRPFSEEMSEQDALSTADVYGATKAAGELFLHAACAQHQMTGVVLRPGPVVGVPAFASAAFRSPNRLARMVDAARRGLPIDARGGEGRQFCSVSALARAVRLLTREPAPLPVYVCVARDVLSWAQVARLVVATTGSSSAVRVDGADSVPVPRFRTERIESLLGMRIDAADALRAHIRHLAGGSG